MPSRHRDRHRTALLGKNADDGDELRFLLRLNDRERSQRLTGLLRSQGVGMRTPTISPGPHNG